VSDFLQLNNLACVRSRGMIREIHGQLRFCRGRQNGERQQQDYNTREIELSQSYNSCISRKPLRNSHCTRKIDRNHDFPPVEPATLTTGDRMDTTEFMCRWQALPRAYRLPRASERRLPCP
jgi:hypothetical protein